MTSQFDENEKLYRAIYPPEKVAMYWKENGELSSAVFKDKRGLSVERGFGRPDRVVAEQMHRNFEGLIYSLEVAECVEEKAYVIYLPSSRSMYHSEIHGSVDRAILSSSQCKALARKAKYVPF